MNTWLHVVVEGIINIPDATQIYNTIPSMNVPADIIEATYMLESDQTQGVGPNVILLLILTQKKCFKSRSNTTTNGWYEICVSELW